jgi:hypothetical protein
MSSADFHDDVGDYKDRRTTSIAAIAAAAAKNMAKKSSS